MGTVHYCGHLASPSPLVGAKPTNQACRPAQLVWAPEEGGPMRPRLHDVTSLEEARGPLLPPEVDPASLRIQWHNFPQF
jgi:hypothetical protein